MAAKTREWDNAIWSLAGYRKTGMDSKEHALLGATLLGRASRVVKVPPMNLGLCERARNDLLLFLGEKDFESAFARGYSLPPEELFGRAAECFSSSVGGTS